MKILAIEREVLGADPAGMRAQLKSEAYRVWELYQQGIIREAYFHAEQHLAVLSLECADLEEAQAVIQTLPLVAAGLIEFDLLPLVPYGGFSRLFAAPEINN